MGNTENLYFETEDKNCSKVISFPTDKLRSQKSGSGTSGINVKIELMKLAHETCRHDGGDNQI